MTCQAIRISSADNTATLLEAGARGEPALVRLGEQSMTLELQEDIPFGHKVAVEAIGEGDPVLKYGEVIGRARIAIAPGAWVHVHNIESTRGRGDLEAEEPSSPGALEDEPQDLGGRLTLEPPILDASGRTFMGYPRRDGSAGTRNFVGVISAVACANDVAMRAAGPHAAVFTHQQGCSQTAPDVRQVERVLAGLGRNPNLGAVVLLSLGCESVRSEWVADEIRRSGKPVELIVLQKEGGLTESAAKARAAVDRLWQEIQADPVPVPFSKLKLGLKCGSSDTTQGLSANLALGRATDIFAACGARVVIGETTEFMGAEHIAARRAAGPGVARAIIEAVSRMEARARAMGVDMRGGQPTRGNIAGGLSTIEEKSLGALAKAGSAVFQAVTGYGEACEAPGLVMMDAPGREPEMLTGLAAAGCNVIAFATGRGAPQGFPFVPVVKVTGNARTWRLMREHMDCFAGGVMTGGQSVQEAGAEVFEALMRAAGGAPTAAERSGYVNSMNIWTTGPVI